MEIELHERTENHVRIYFERAQDVEVKKYLSQTVASVKQALENFAGTQKTDATSYGRTIYVDGVYIGDIWCYAMNLNDTPQAMVSYCIFDKSHWGKGVMSGALALFLSEISNRYGIISVGAFSFSENTASVRVLEKNGFRVLETFSEDGMDSVYLQK